IRDGHVTGVQTCALPISVELTRRLESLQRADIDPIGKRCAATADLAERAKRDSLIVPLQQLAIARRESQRRLEPLDQIFSEATEIGRASCREGSERLVVV